MRALEYCFLVAKQRLVSCANAAVGGLTAVFKFVVEGCFEEDCHGVYFYFCGGRVAGCSFDCLAWLVVLWLLWVSILFPIQQDAQVVLGGIFGHVGGDVVSTRQRRCIEIPRWRADQYARRWLILNYKSFVQEMRDLGTPRVEEEEQRSKWSGPRVKEI